MARKKVGMAEAELAGVSEGRASSTTRSGLSRQLVAASQEVKAAYETEHQWRLDLIKANEELSRETGAIESEIGQLQQKELELKTLLSGLAKQREALSGEVKDLTRQCDTLQREQEKLQPRRDELEEEVEGLRRENENLGKDTAKLKAEVERLDALRREYLSQISKFRQQKAKLVGE
jgi:chromosome segregation ATPase